MSRTHVVTALVVAFSLLVAACSATAAPEDYFTDVAEIGSRQDEAAASIVAPGTAPTREQIAEIVELRREALLELRALDPPDTVAALHGEFAASLEELVVLAEAFLTETEGASPTEFLDALNTTTEIDEAQRRFTAFCRTLEIEAEGLGVERVDLSC